MATQATATLTLQYTPPSAPTNSGSAVFTLTTTLNAQNVGQIDVTPTDLPADTFNVPFGSVSKAKLLVIKNLTSNDIGVRINAAVTDTFVLPSGGEFVYGGAAAPSTTPITGVTLVLKASPLQIESLQYWVFGD